MFRSLVLATLLLAAPALSKPPKLTVFIVVDSLGSDLLLRSRPQFHAGLKTLLDGGAYYPYARYEYAQPMTAAGHTTLSTGANPWKHGIVGNKVFNRVTGKEEKPFSDAAHPLLEAPLSADDVSPENLMVETLSDRLREFTRGRGKAVALSLKGRAAIPLAGRQGQAYWFSSQVGKFVTGTYYAKEFPAWLRAFNDRKLPDSYYGKDWTLLQPAKSYLGDDDRPYENGSLALGRTFPHPITGGLSAVGEQYYDAFGMTPYSGDVLVLAAKAAIEGEGLGKDDVPDLLAVSFSQTDRILHHFGPYSWEAQDAMARLDRQVGDLLAAAEKAAGKGNVLVVLSSDHGSDATTEELAAEGMPAVRIVQKDLKAALNKELASRFRATDFIGGMEGQAIYLKPTLAADKTLDVAAIRRAAALYLRTLPGVATAVTREDIMSGADLGGFGRALRLGFFADRSGDIFLIPRPHTVLMEDGIGATHLTPYAYDQQIPVVFYGKPFKKGLYRSEIHPTDVAPTLAAVLEMGPPASVEGVVRTEALEAR